MPAQLNSLDATGLPDRRIEWVKSTPSTMILAARLAREGCPHGTIVGADSQTAGMGRHGRVWHSEPGAGLYVSFVLRIPSPAPVTMLALGLAAHEAIAATGLRPDLRWPNDVLVNGRKCAGVLAQMEPGAVIAGIGINIGQRDFPPGLETPATSLLLEGVQTSRESILTSLAHAIDNSCALPPAEIIDRFEARSSFVRGCRVRVESGLEGVTHGLDASGFLIVREDNGKETAILAGGVRPI